MENRSSSDQAAAQIIPWTILDSLAECLAVLDADGRTLYRNAAWNPPARRAAGGAPPLTVGEDFVAAYRRAYRLSAEETQRLGSGLHAVLQGSSICFEMEHSYDEAGAQQWAALTIQPYRQGALEGALVQRRTITGYKRVEGEVLHATLEALEDGILATDSSGRLVGSNRRFAELWDIPTEVVESGDDRRAIQVVLSRLVNPETFAAQMKQLAATPEAQSYDTLELSDGRIFERYSRPLRVGEEIRGRVWSFRDISERRRAEEALRRSALQEEMIRGQSRVLEELSTPLFPVSEQVLVMPLVGSLDSRRAQQVISSLLEGVGRQRARIAIIDITGVPVVDTQVADALLRAAQAVRLLGAQVVLTGIRPEVAQTLVGLGVNLDELETRGSLQDGIAYALDR